MTDLVLRRLSQPAGWPPAWARLMGVVGALALGVALARLPLLWAAVGLAALILGSLILMEPLVGVCLVLLLGPTKPLTDYFVPQLPLDLGQIALILTLGSWFLQAARKRAIQIPRSPINLPLLVFIGAASLSLLNALSAGYAFRELIKWVQIVLMMWLVIDRGERGRWRFVLGAVLGIGAIEALIGIWQFALRGDGPEHFLILGDRFYRAYGTFEQPNPYGGFLGLVLPVALGLVLAALGAWLGGIAQRLCERQMPAWQAVVPAALNRGLLRWLGLGMLGGLLLAGLLMSWSRGAWLGFGVAAAAILFAWPRRAAVGAVLLIASMALGLLALRFNLLPPAISTRLGGFSDFTQSFDVRGVDITPANYAVIERLAHWQAAREMARYHPWLGVGWGNYEPVYPAYALINWPYPLGHAHNIYLNLLAETGIIGLAAYLALWISVLWQTWRQTRHLPGWQRGLAVGLLGAWVHLAVHQAVDNLYVANLHLHIGALFGILTLLGRSTRGDQTT